MLYLVASGCGSTSNAGSPSNDELRDGIVAGQYLFDYGAGVEARLERERQAQEVIALCMERNGFEYVAPPPIQPPLAHLALTDETLSETDYATQWGFGVTTAQNFSGAEEPDLSPEELQKLQEEADAAFYDPLSDMEPAEARSYLESLSGRGGCQDEAYGNQQQLGLAYDASYDSIQEAVKAFATGPESTTYFDEWSTCMAQKGFDRYPSPLAIRIDLQDRVVEAAGRGQWEFIESELREREMDLAVETVRCGGSVKIFLPDALVDAWLGYASEI